ncbi:MAG: signal peptidase I [Lentisphaeria bacterium]|nr:signal peptidase I [Lentisphaeria bacterium]
MGKLWALWQKVCTLHRSDDATADGEIANFFLPRFTVGFFIRMGIVAAVALVVFGFFLKPSLIRGASMEPTYRSTGFNFCWRGKYYFREPKLGDVVIVRLTGRIYYLKRIVALPGDTVEFRRGYLYVNGEKVHEPYVKFVCDWELPPRKVEPGNYYVIGDNRSMPIDVHMFGQVPRHRIAGGPLW